VSDKSVYEEKMENQIHEWGRAITQLEDVQKDTFATISRRPGWTRTIAQYSRRLKTMRAIKEIAARKLELSKSVDESDWTAIKKDIDEHWDRMRAAFSKCRNRVE
jgi:hypothetical protein